MSGIYVRTFSDIYTAVMEELKVQSADTTTRDRIKRIVNYVYMDEVAPAENWTWLRGQANLVHNEYFNTGTLSATQNSTTITFSIAPAGSREGSLISISGETEVYRIGSHAANATSAELQTPYVGTTDTAKTFKLWTDAIPLPADARETFQVTHDYMSVPLDGCGLQKLQEHIASSPKQEGRPAYYSTSDYVDPAPYATVAGLPSLTSRASAGLVKTLVFGTSVEALFEVGQRIRITSAGHYTYNGEWVVASVSGATLIYTGVVSYTEAATADSSLTLNAATVKGAFEQYRNLIVYPAINDKKTILKVSYTKEVRPLVGDTDEPLIPVSDRVVLVYGALKQAWASIKRQDTDSARNAMLFDAKLKRMQGRMDDSLDKPMLRPSKTYLARKRARPTSSSFGASMRAGGGSSGGTTSTALPLNTPQSVAVFDNTGTLNASTTISTTELGYLDGATSNIQTQINAINTLPSGNIYLGNASNVAAEVAPAGDVTISNTGVTAITSGVIIDSDVNAAAAIAYSKLNLAGAVKLVSDVTGTLPIANGGTNVTSVTTAPAATSFAGWDANKNLSTNSLIEGYATTATAAGTTTLLVGSAFQQYFTGSSTQTVLMPVTSTLVAGQQYAITNLSSGVVTVQSSGANTIQAMAANTQLLLTCISTSGTGTGSWSWEYAPAQSSLLSVAQGGTGVSSLSGSGTLVPAYTAPSTYTVTITGSSANPGKGTMTADLAYTMKNGKMLTVGYTYVATTGGSAGTGTYLFSINGFTADTSFVRVSTTGFGSATVVGSAIVGSGTNQYIGAVWLYDSTHLAIQFTNDTINPSPAFGSTSNTTLATANVTFSFTATFPVTT
jgi:hypothetical protein